MKKLALNAAVFTAALCAASAFAQMGPGMGAGMGGGMGPGKGRFAWNQEYMPGWKLMTPEERAAWQAQMREVKTYEECIATQQAHRQAMEERAQEKGVKLLPPRRNGCDVMKARGIIK